MMAGRILARYQRGEQAGACAVAGVAVSPGVRATDAERPADRVGDGGGPAGSVCEVPAAAGLGTRVDRAEPAAPAGGFSV